MVRNTGSQSPCLANEQGLLVNPCWLSTAARIFSSSIIAITTDVAFHSFDTATAIQQKLGRFPSAKPPSPSVCWQRWILHGLPETLGLLHAAVFGSRFFEAVTIVLLVRLSWISAEVIHGAGHTLTCALVDRSCSLISLENLLEHRSVPQMARSLLPLAPIGPAGNGQGLLPMAWLPVGDPEAWKVRLKASGGILLQGAAIVLAGAAMLQFKRMGVESQLANDLLMSMISSHVCLLLASRSDWHAICTGQASLLCCGNFGLIAAPVPIDQGELLSAQAVDIYQRMGRETELRGAQAGGGLVMSVDRQGGNAFVGHRIVNAKRGDLTPSLEAGFRRQRRQAHRRGCRPHPAGLMACWHYRFGTSGPPAVQETHWLEWTPPRQRRLWRRIANQRWEHTWQTVHHRITHNGDFEALESFGMSIDTAASLGAWLEKALDQPSPAVVDSARIAGMMDLMICQGDWFAAVRWAYLNSLADFPNTPSETELQEWSEQFEGAFMEQALTWDPSAQITTTGSEGINRLMEAILARVCSNQLLRMKGEQALQHWIGLAIDLFLHNDPCQAVKQFMERARGSFGLVVISTTLPDRLVLSSLGQPITVGVDPLSRMALYASESAAVDAVLAGHEEAWRIDLDDNAGEIAVLSSSKLHVYSLSLGSQVSPQDIYRRRHFYGQKHDRRALARFTNRSRSRDPVADDINDIPALLARIRDDWSNPGSNNRQSADELAQLLIAKAANLACKAAVLRQAGLDDSLARSNHVDLLITGVENSLWLGEQFAKDLTTLMPRLTVKALSANAALHAIQDNFDNLALARQSIVLVLSHTSRTFPSRQLMEASDLMVRSGVIRELFILTGEPESLLGSPMLTEQKPGEPFSRRLFTTSAGRRRAEPATASVAAMHQTLTELLFALSRQLLQAYPEGKQHPLGMSLSKDELSLLESKENNAFLRESSEIVGADHLGQGRDTGTSCQIKRAGQHWALHILETPIAWMIHALYILISLVLGLPLAQTLLSPAIAAAGPTVADLLTAGGLWADVGIYIFGPWFWTLGLRWMQGRPLLARTGRRSLVIGEAPWIHQLMTNYISKLFSLSFGIASLDVQGADVGDHLLHTHAHRLVRGSLLFFGCPDGRFSQLKRAEADAVLLAARQADGIRHWDIGPEIVAVGTEPAMANGPFRKTLVLPLHSQETCVDGHQTQSRPLIETIRESRFGGFRRLLASYVFFWAMARDVGRLPLLEFKWWRSQSRTRVMTTAAPVSAARLDVAEPRERAELALHRYADREQS
jgi:hypothetical protein